jgi:hypothetical protein
MGVRGKRFYFEFFCSVLEWLRRAGECKRDESPRGHPGESGERKLWQRRRWQESLSDRFSRKRWQHVGQHQPSECIE